ncbi:PAS domain S-box protein, partial [Floridanema evergladense]
MDSSDELTSLKQAEAEIQITQQCYRELAEAMPQMVWTADATGLVNYWNQRWYEYTGLSEAESMGLAGAMTIHPTEYDRTLAKWSQSVAKVESFEIEHRIRRWDGTYRWFINRGIPTSDREGQNTGWIGTITDIDEQKRLEERFRLAMRAINGLVFDWNLETNQVYRSEKLFDLLGFYPEDVPLTSTWWHERIHPDDLARLQLQMQEWLANSSQLYETEYRILHHDGHWVDVWERGCLIRDEQGQVTRIVGSTEDITKRKRTQFDLREAHIQLEAALAAGSIYTWRWNIALNSVVTNRSFAQLFGVEPEGAARGLPIERFLNAIHPEDKAQVVNAIERAIVNRENYIAEFRIYNADGEERWMIAKGKVEYDDYGKPIAFPGALADITDRKQAELQRQRSEAMLQAFMRACPISLAFFDRELRFLYVNEALAQMNDLPLDAALGKTLWEVLPLMAPQFAPILRQVMETQKPVLNLEFNGEVSPGVFRSTIANHYPVCLPSGEVIGVGVSVMDITELATAQQELRESEERFRTLADNISQFAWMTDETGWIFWYNQRWFDYTGTTLEEMQGWGWQKVHHPNHVERVVQKFRHSMETGEAWEDTFPLRGKDGTYRWFLSRAIPVRDREGKVSRWFGTNTDITDLRQTEQALRQTSERLNVALKSTPITLFNQDLNLRYTWIYNPTHNYAVEEVIGKRDEDLVSEETATRLTQLKQQVLDTGIALREEVKVTRDEQTCYYDLTIDPLRDSRNAIVGITCAAVDISERKQLEAEREQLFQQEQAAREAAERANRIKDEFLAVLSHELRSPLNPILGWAKLLQTRTFDEAKTKQALSTIERNARLQTQLIDDLLDIAKILRGKLSLNIDSVNLSCVIEAAIETVRAAAVAKSICLTVSTGNGEMGRWGDGGMGRWGDGERRTGEMGRWGDGERSRTRNSPHPPTPPSPYLPISPH